MHTRCARARRPPLHVSIVQEVQQQQQQRRRGHRAARPPVLCVASGQLVSTEVVNMAADGMVLTNHDHQIRVGILTGRTATGFFSD